jgi:hypothetical protein
MIPLLALSLAFTRSNAQTLGPLQTFSTGVPPTVQQTVPLVNTYPNCIDLQPYAPDMPSVRMYWSYDTVNNATNILMRVTQHHLLSPF